MSFLSAQCGRAAITITLAVAFLFGALWIDGDDSYAASLKAPVQPAEAVVVSLASLGFPADKVTEPSPLEDDGVQPQQPESCEITNSAGLSRLVRLSASHESTPASLWLPTASDTLHRMNHALVSTGAGGIDLLTFSRLKAPAEFAAAYQSVRKLAAVMELPRIERDSALMQATIVGTVSTYNPFREGKEEGDAETASGELYDPDGWTAAIKLDLRGQFGGVRYGKLYQPTYALVDAGDRRAIVKINDVGPLKPGRVLDLNERSMRYFDPFLTRGLLDGVKITLLPGEDWTPGPVEETYLIELASAQ